MVCNGQSPPPGFTVSNTAETWDGTSWTEVADLPENAVSRSGFGTSTAGIVCGGDTGSISAETDSWDGSSWTEVADLNEGKQYVASAGLSSDLSLAFGGNTPSVTVNTESWNGSAWTEVNNMSFSSASRKGTPSSSSVSSLASGGTPGPGDATTTEEWTALLSNRTITIS